MAVNLSTLTVCLLATVILHAYDSSERETNVTEPTTAMSTSIAVESSEVTSSPFTQASSATTQDNSTSTQASSATTQDNSKSTQASSTPTQSSSTSTQSSSTPTQSSEETGLSGGEIAGIAVGSIAGVAAIGGGIFAGLKFSGKLG